VRENLVLGRPDADAGQIDEALSIAQAEFAHDLPWGLDTRVGEQGLSLSGGQRQRLALARALVSDASFMILDEPIAHLDAPLARRVLRGVLEHATDRGVLAITTTRRRSPTSTGFFGSRAEPYGSPRRSADRTVAGMQCETRASPGEHLAPEVDDLQSGLANLPRCGAGNRRRRGGRLSASSL
jgi:hypothetical protein